MFALENRFDVARHQLWTDPANDGLVSHRCPIEPGHANAARNWMVSAFAEAPEPAPPLVLADVLANANHACFLISGRLERAMQQAGLTGWTSYPATIRMRDGRIVRDYRELRISGFGGIAPAQTGNRLMWQCAGCGIRKFAPGLRRDLAGRSSEFSGLDFWIVWPLSGLPFCSERAQAFLRQFDAAVMAFRPMADIASPLMFYGDEPIPPHFSADARQKIEAFWAMAPRWPTP